LNDGARSSLPQYLQTNCASCDDVLYARAAAFVVFEDGAALGLARTTFFLAGADDTSAESCFAEVVTRLPLPLTNPS
jgi:hypothetical protein